MKYRGILGGTLKCARVNNLQKNPYEQEWQKINDYTLDHVGPASNYAILTGEVNNIIVIDVDLYKISNSCSKTHVMDKIFSIREDEFTARELDTFTVKTPRGGIHMYFQYQPDRFSHWYNEIGLYGCVDIKTNGGCVIGPGSRTENGVYGIINDVDFKPMPDIFYGLINLDLLGKLEQKQKGIDKDKQLVLRDYLEDPEAIQEIIAKLDLISSEYVDNYADTRNFIWSCCSTTNRSILDKCREVCKRNPKYNLDVDWFDKVVDYYTNGSFTIATAMYMAKQSNPEEFSKLSKKHRKYTFNEEFFTDTELAGTFFSIYGENYLYQNATLYFFNGDLWIRNAVDAIIYKCISTDFYKYLYDKIEAIFYYDQEKLSYNLKQLLVLKNHSKINNIVASFTNTIKNHYARLNCDILFDMTSHLDNCLNFKNGILDVSLLQKNVTGKITNLEQVFRKRVRTDYVTMTLPYDFEVDSNIIGDRLTTVDKIFKTINPIDEMLKFTYSWAAYNMLGKNNEQYFLFNVGYSASNGKTTETMIHNRCLSIYSMKADSDMFNENFTKDHKLYGNLKKKPIRHIYIEELSDKRLNNTKLKSFTGARTIATDILYSTYDEVKCTAKLTICSNKDPYFSRVDEGIIRRGLMKLYTQQFVSREKYDKLSAKNRENTHIADIRLLERFEDDDLLKNAYIHCLLPYAIDIYSNDSKLVIPYKLIEQYQSTIKDYDIFKCYMGELFELTENPEDIVAKDKFIDLMNTKYKNKFSWSWGLKELKQFKGIEYDKDKRFKNKKGVIVGIKEKCHIDIGEVVVNID